MAFFDYDRNGKKDWKDNAREYYLYNKLKEDDASKHNRGRRKNHPMMGNQMLGVVLYYCVLYLCFV
ncbi:hypothetical protein [Anaerostipes sp.]|uniref:hypothetical protein n=1 Tax=Anaerostipes sp. TaxID=1872530 RepID=UPI003529614A